MLKVEKKKRKNAGQWAWLTAALLGFLAAAGVYFLAEKPPEMPEMPVNEGYQPALLMEKNSHDVLRVSVQLRMGEGWTLVQQDGRVSMADDEHFAVDEAWAEYIMDAVAIVESPAMLTADAQEYAAHLVEYGLDDPRAVIAVEYSGGESITLRIGDVVSTEVGSWLYMTVDGDPALYALDKGTADILTTDRSLLRATPQLTLHAQRFDRIRLERESECVEWVLEGSIGNSDALDRWKLMQPLEYPADAGAVQSLRQHIESLRLGAWVSEATEENLYLYGFDAPRLVLSVHQAAGSMGTTNAAGEYEVTPWPESTFTLQVGGAKSADVDYVLWDGNIYIASHYALSSLMEMNWRETLTRFPVLTALGNLRRLTVEKNDVQVEDVLITRTEQVARNNELVTDFGGQVVYDYTCTRNGSDYSYDSFASAYGRLVTVLVSGILPEGWQPETEAHTVFRFEDMDGRVHTVALTGFDALHDAVLVDGYAMFYLIKDGFRLILE